LVLISLLLGWAANAECVHPPYVNGDSILFANRVTIRYRGAEKTPAPDPQPERSVVETLRILPTLHRVVIVREEQFSEGGAVQLKFFDFCGRRLGYSDRALINASPSKSVFFPEIYNLP
jgi:hypothetical protein